MAKKNKAVTRVIKSKADAEKVKTEVEKIFERGDAPTVQEMVSLARKSGRPLPEIMKQVNQIRKSMMQAKAKVEENGEYFDEREYLSNLMDESAKL